MLSAGTRVGNAPLCEQENQYRLWAGGGGYVTPTLEGGREPPCPGSLAAPALPDPLEGTTRETEALGALQWGARFPGLRGRWPQPNPGTRRAPPPSPALAPLRVPPPGAAPGARQWPVSMATGQARPERPGRCPVRAPLPQRAPRGLPAGRLCAPGPRPPLLAHPALTSGTARSRRVAARLPHRR